MASHNFHANVTETFIMSTRVKTRGRRRGGCNNLSQHRISLLDTTLPSIRCETQLMTYINRYNTLIYCDINKYTYHS